jgi:hypothetical protein
LTLKSVARVGTIAMTRAAKIVWKVRETITDISASCGEVEVGPSFYTSLAPDD